jgi:hypothetical protein
MSQSGYTPIITYNSGTTTNVPIAGNLANGELAINYADGKLFYKDSGGVVQVLASKSGNVNVSSFSAGTTGFTPSTATSGAVTLSGTLATTNGGTGLTSFTANGVVYASSTSALVTGSALTFDGTNFATTGKIGAGGTPGLYTQIWSTGNIMAVDGGQIGFLTSSAGAPGNYMTGSNASNYLAWIANNSEQMRLTSTGLGIGTSSPVSKLNVSGTTGLTWASNGTSLGLVTLGTQGTGGSLFVNTPSVNGSFASGFGVDGSYSGGKSVINLKAFGTSSGGSYSADFAFYTSVNSTSTEVMRLDSSGNLGLGVTPSAWSSSYHSIDIGSYASFYSVLTGSPSTAMGNNTYGTASGSVYKNTAAATIYQQYGGAHYWYNAPSGTAGNAITFTQAMTLDNSGNLGIGTTSPNTYLQVGNGSGSSQNYIWASGNSTNPPSSATYGVLLGTNLSQGNSEANLVWGQGISSSQYFAIGKWTGSAYSEQMRLDSSGNLGLGVTPSAWYSGAKALQIGTGSQFAIVNFSSIQSGLVFNAYYNGSNYVYQNSSPASILDFNNAATGGYAWRIAASGTAGNTISFTQAMTLDNSGNLLVGTTSQYSSSGHIVTNTSTATYGIAIQDTATTTGLLNFTNSAGTQVGNIIVVSGTTVAYQSVSDYRLKTNIVDAPEGNIDQIKIRSFDWKSTGEHSVYGVIAQELLEVAPYAVHQPANPDEMMGVDYSKLVPMMIKEIQSLKAEVATLKGA